MEKHQRNYNAVFRQLQGRVMLEKYQSNPLKYRDKSTDGLMLCLLYLWWQQSQRNPKQLWYCIVSNATLQDLCNFSRATLQRAKQRLVNQGYLKIVRRYAKDHTGELVSLYTPGPRTINTLRRYPQVYEPQGRTRPLGALRTGQEP